MRIWAGWAVLLALASCVAPKAPPPPSAPPPVPVRPAPPPPAPPVAWEDLPATPGTWRYAEGEARFGPEGAPPLLVMRCAAERSIQFERPGVGTATTDILFNIATSAGSTALAGQSLSSRPAALATTRAADPFLDKIAFSRGHFTVSVSGQPMLVLPAWPEVSRVIEDCRG